MSYQFLPMLFSKDGTPIRFACEMVDVDGQPIRFNLRASDALTTSTATRAAVSRPRFFHVRKGVTP